MHISLIIPAHNEERYLGETLTKVRRAGTFGQSEIELIVVDNDSNDSTADIARSMGAAVVGEPVRNVGRARNKGASTALGQIFVFLDADTLVPEGFFSRIEEVMNDPACFGGAVDTNHPNRRWVQLYLELWRLVGRMAGMAQGAAQFCRGDAFAALGGYDETLYMGEDVDFFWRLSALARRRNGTVHLVEDIQVTPSTRRFDQWPAWRILVWTNPFFVWLFRRRKKVWRGWYEQPVR